MVRVFVLYDQEPEAGRYEEHAELCRQVPGGTFRHGKVFGAPIRWPLTSKIVGSWCDNSLEASL